MEEPRPAAYPRRAPGQLRVDGGLGGREPECRFNRSRWNRRGTYRSIGNRRVQWDCGFDERIEELQQHRQPRALRCFHIEHELGGGQDCRLWLLQRWLAGFNLVGLAGPGDSAPTLTLPAASNEGLATSWLTPGARGCGSHCGPFKSPSASMTSGSSDVACRRSPTWRSTHRQRSPQQTRCGQLRSPRSGTRRGNRPSLFEPDGQRFRPTLEFKPSNLRRSAQMLCAGQDRARPPRRLPPASSQWSRAGAQAFAAPDHAEKGTHQPMLSIRAVRQTPAGERREEARCRRELF